MSHDSPFFPLNSAPDADPRRNISSLDPKLSRTNYYDGRLLKAADLTRDQLYLDERLREVGRVLGHGIVRGLEVKINRDGVMRVSPGLAIATSGRVLELEGESLAINLYDSAQIASLNQGFRRFERGLYAVTLQYAEAGSGSAEIYPRDLEGERGFQFNAYAEGVEVTLVPLKLRTPRFTPKGADSIASSVSARAGLVRELISNPDQLLEISEEGVALGLLSIENGRPMWLDRGLLRRPMRSPNEPYQLQRDLQVHYEELFQDVLQMREQSARRQEFPAAHYFSLLPPFGSVPRDSIDPERGKQGYFPESFDVSIAPVREDDLPTILAQSEALDPIDLEKERDVDIMLLVPMGDHEFAWRARQLEQNDDGHNKLVHVDPLALRLYGKGELPADSTNAAVWRAIWAQTNQLIYVRRPTRVAETQVSAVVLASGYERPDPEAGLPPDMEAFALEKIQLEEALSALQKENAALQAELEEDRGEQLAEAEARIETLQKEIAILLARLSEDDAEIPGQIAELISENNRLRQQLAEANELIEQLQQGNGNSNSNDAALQAEISVLTQRLKEAEATIEALKNRDDGAEGVRPPSIEELVRYRGVKNEVALKAAAELEQVVKDDPQRLGIISSILLYADRKYDAPLWPTLLLLADNKRLFQFLALLREDSGRRSIAEVVVKEAQVIGVNDNNLLLMWQALLKEERPVDRSTNSPVNRADNRFFDRVVMPSIVDNSDFSAVKVVPLEVLAKNRGFNDEAILKDLLSVVGRDPALVALINQIAALVAPRYDVALWRSLPAIIKGEAAEKFRDFLLKAVQRDMPLGLAVATTNRRYQLNAKLRSAWADLDFER